MTRLMRLPPQRIFLLLFVPLALAMLLITPIMRVPDEQAHLGQAYVMASGQTLRSLTTGRYACPEGLLATDDPTQVTLRDAAAMLGEGVSPARVEASRNPATALYPPLSYAPQALGMGLGLLTGNRALSLYGARLGNLACVTALLYWAIRLLPRGKLLAIAFTLMPLSLQQAASASPDGGIMALTFAMTAFVLDRCQRGRLPRRDLWALALLCLGLATWKIFYLPMALMTLMLPAACFGTRRDKACRLGAMLAGAALLLGAWLLACWALMFSGATQGPTGQTAGNLQRLLAAPWAPLTQLLPTLWHRGAGYVGQLLGYGKAFSWFNADIGWLWLAQAPLLVALWRCDEGHALPLRRRGLLAGLCAACVVAGLMMLWLWWNPAESPLIEGFQGRYLLPLLLPLAAALTPAWKRTFPRAALLLLMAQATLSAAAILRLAGAYAS